MRPQTVIELAHANGVPLPSADPTELYSYDSLDSYLEIFWLVQSTLATASDWARVAYEAVVDSAAHGVVHQECFFTPARHLAAGLSLDEILAGLDEGIAAAEAETGTTCRLIGDMDRAFGPAAGLAFVEDLVRDGAWAEPGILKAFPAGGPVVFEDSARGVAYAVRAAWPLASGWWRSTRCRTTGDRSTSCRCRGATTPSAC